MARNHVDPHPETAAVTNPTAPGSAAAADAPVVVVGADAPADAAPALIPSEGAAPGVNERRVAANRRNAQRSTGPRTEAGKARSRANAVRHGLAGEGICLPTEDAALVRERCLLLHEEIAPTTIRGMMLVEVVALAHTRIKRAARQEVAALSYRQRLAIAEHDDARLTEAEKDLDRIDGDTTTRHRRLVASPEGVDLLIARLRLVRSEVRNSSIRWNYIHGHCFENLCGRKGDSQVVSSRGWALSLALEFDPSQLTDDDRAAIGTDNGQAVREWAKPQMEALIDAEIARLEAHRLTLDHALFARERAEAPERAMFDAGRDAALARRYEGAATRTLFRALQELDNLARGCPEPDPDTPSALDEPTTDVAEVLDHGDHVVIIDPADRAAEPIPPPRSREPKPLASFGITAQNASDVISQPHADTPPVPFDQPVPPLEWSNSARS